MSDWWSQALGVKRQPSNLAEAARQEIMRSSTPPVAVPQPTPGQMVPAGPSAFPAQQDDEPITVDNVYRKAMTWKGGEATRSEGSLTCPKCGDPRVFTRSNGGTSLINSNSGQRANPAPRCFSCGWNGMYEQAQGPGA